tara:strand:+ start:2460 stop:2648 length:189 start_codon:yes stop_codon:yes gene_type:complete
MLNLFIKNAVRRVAVKLATDKNFRSKAKIIIKNTQELKEKGLLMKSLGKTAGRLKSKLKRDL